jgi:hypothetical protein
LVSAEASDPTLTKGLYFRRNRLRRSVYDACS